MSTQHDPQTSWLASLHELSDKGLYRSLRQINSPQLPEIQIENQNFINFASNDYLGLSSHPELKEAAIEAIQKWGVGSGSSRLVSGSLAPHHQLEEAISTIKKTEASLTFTSGFTAAIGTITALATPSDVIILDKLCHASLIDGARLAKSILRIFPHNNLPKLEEHLAWARKNHPHAKIFILTEAVFSMDGDVSPLREIVHLKNEYGAILMVDEAHSFGLFGPSGAGLLEEYGLSQQVEIQMSTFSKAAGCSGGAISGSRALIDLLINKARSFIYTTAPPPANACVLLKSLELIRSHTGNQLRQKLRKNIQLIAPEHLTPIIPWVIGSETDALAASQELLQQGLFVPAIRYPTVPKNAARLRISLTASHSTEAVQKLSKILQKVKK